MYIEEVGLWERPSPGDKIQAPMEETPHLASIPSAFFGSRKQPSPDNLNLLCLDLGFLSLQNCEKINFSLS
jgi:hypothetical protein